MNLGSSHFMYEYLNQLIHWVTLSRVNSHLSHLKMSHTVSNEGTKCPESKGAISARFHVLQFNLYIFHSLDT